jgi:hypothetical protein
MNPLRLGGLDSLGAVAPWQKKNQDFASQLSNNRNMRKTAIVVDSPVHKKHNTNLCTFRFIPPCHLSRKTHGTLVKNVSFIRSLLLVLQKQNTLIVKCTNN